MFPDVCPDHLLALVTTINGEEHVGKEVNSGDSQP